MKIGIGHRLFIAVLLAMLTVAGTGVLLLRHKVLGSFGDYAVGIELDRLDGLSNAVARQYREHGDWRFVPGGDARRGWITQELARLQTHRVVAPVMPVGAD
jgi:two-component system sensor histidine kinase BaeS